uniref:Uncharacterized protein n=1 Tax=Arundo donax TaxID=35708 RepID=A0A0A9C4S7_ARUDO
MHAFKTGNPTDNYWCLKLRMIAIGWQKHSLPPKK